jgi:hypothetical protein
MPGLAALDVVIGLIFIYLVASLIASAVNELIENIVRYRSKDLERGIQELIGHDGSDIVKKLYNHPLVSGLFQGTYDQARSKNHLPAYIPSRNFALALMDIVGRAEAGLAAVSGAANSLAVRGAATEGQNPLAALRMAAVNMGATNERVSKALVTLIDAAGADASRARQNIEEWFDSSMDRVSGWYKRRSQWFLIFVGLLMAAVGNIDSINIVNVLSKDPAKRAALVAQAQEYAKNPTPVNPAMDDIDKLGLPIGWSSGPAGAAPDPRSLPVDWKGWVGKVLGIFATAFAVSLGAPFWFDMLNKVTVVRSTVKPQEKSPPEKSKD